MATIAKLSYSQSTSGGIITFTDESVLDNPISNYTRKVMLYSGRDGTGTLIEEIDFVGTNLTCQYEISADQYFSAILVHTGSPTVANFTLNFTTQQFEQNALNKLLKSNCGCGKTKNCDKISLGFIYLTQSQVATSAGNSGLANEFISNAYKLLTS
jgi:hypothetical protein